MSFAINVNREGTMLSDLTEDEHEYEKKEKRMWEGKRAEVKWMKNQAMSHICHSEDAEE
jgi:hypothetical protein